MSFDMLHPSRFLGKDGRFLNVAYSLANPIYAAQALRIRESCGSKQDAISNYITFHLPSFRSLAPEPLRYIEKFSCDCLPCVQFASEHEVDRLVSMSALRWATFASRTIPGRTSRVLTHVSLHQSKSSGVSSSAGTSRENIGAITPPESHHYSPLVLQLWLQLSLDSVSMMLMVKSRSCTSILPSLCGTPKSLLYCYCGKRDRIDMS